jgi:septal ring factor EnvC (AmiA/AmiB activator)
MYLTNTYHHPTPITMNRARESSLKLYRPLFKKQTFITFQLYVFALVAGIALSFAMSDFAVAQSEEDYEKKLRELSNTIDEIQRQLTSTRTSKDKLQQSLQVSEQEIGEYTKKIKEIKEALSREKKQLNQYQSNRIVLEKSRQGQQTQINQITRQAYLLGQQSQIKLLLNQEEPAKMTRMLRYHDYIISAHKEKIDRYITTIADINKSAANIIASTTRLTDNQAKLNDRFQSLKNTQARRLQTLAALTREISLKGGDLTNLQRDQDRLQRLLEEATQALSQLILPSDAKPFRSLKGKLPYPSKGRILQSYGQPRLDGRLRWRGLFISGKSGDQVVSVHHGRVIFSDYLGGHGLLLIIDHGDGYMSLYAHNQALLKDTGDWVGSNDIIATLGNSGGQAQEGLYFEIRYNGKPQNPSPWLATKK